MKTVKIIALILVIGLFIANCSSNNDWRTANRDSAGIAPDPFASTEAVVHVYGASAWSWRGWFAIHTWIATKKSNENHYTVYDVIGWRQHHGGPVMRAYKDIPDRFWYGEEPELLQSHSGDGVDQLIDKIDNAAHSYPWKTNYKVYPGPNSNTFTAWIAKQVPELELDLPFTAIGKNFIK